MNKRGTNATFTTFVLSACLVYPGNGCLGKNKIIFQSMVPHLDPLPAPKVLKGSVVESDALPPPLTNAFGYTEIGSRYPTVITYVAPRSVAWLGGLQPGDHVLNGRVKSGKAILVVQRGGKKYGCVLNADALSGPGGGAAAQTAGSATGKLSAKAEHTDTQTLASYAIAMVVDNSASMGTKDCPGGVSRWQWCKDHISELYGQDNGVLQKNISIVTFDSNFHSRQNCSPADLQSIFASGSPEGETNMAPALEEAFLLVRQPLNMGKPAIVTVISDGRPSDVDNVKKTIIREVNALSQPKLLSLVFIEVGTPEHYLQELDNDLVKQGAVADIVKVIAFSAANSQGLSKTLASTIPKAAETKPLPASVAATSTTNSQNKAREAVASHIYVYNASTGPAKRPVVQAAPSPRAASVPAPAIKAHPSGTPIGGAVKAAKPVEVDEKAAALRGSANRTYK